MRSIFFLVCLVLAVCLPPYMMGNQNGKGNIPQDVRDNLTKDSSSLLGDIVDLGKGLFSGHNQQPQNSTQASTTELYDNGKIYISVYEPGYGWKYIPNPYNEYWQKNR